MEKLSVSGSYSRLIPRAQIPKSRMYASSKRKIGCCRFVGLPPFVAISNFLYGHHGSPRDRAAFSTFQKLDAVAGTSVELVKEQGEFTCATSAEWFGPSDATGPAVRRSGRGHWSSPSVPTGNRPSLPPTVIALRTDRHATWLIRQSYSCGHSTQCRAEK